MARLGRYANVQPDQFGAMTPAQTLEMNRAVTDLLNDEWRGSLELVLTHAKFVGGR